MCRAIVDNVLSGTKAGFKATRNLVFNQKAERSTMNRQKSRAIVENVLSGTKAGFKATRNLVFNQKAERSTMNRQKSRGLVENVLSGMKAGFKSILNIFKHPKRESRMFNQKSSSTLSTTLLALILGASVFMAGQVWAAEMVKDPSTGKMVTAAVATTIEEQQRLVNEADMYGIEQHWYVAGQVCGFLHQASQGEAAGYCLWDYHSALDSGGDLRRCSGSLSLYGNALGRQADWPISPVSAGYRPDRARPPEPPDRRGSHIHAGRPGSDHS